MAKELKGIRLYSVRTAENVVHCGIEARSANEAIDIATHHKGEQVYDATCQKIYEGSIFTETTGKKSCSNTDIFEIKVRGTNAKAVDELKKCIAKLINGPTVAFEYGMLNSVDEAVCSFMNARDDLELCVSSL